MAGEVYVNGHPLSNYQSSDLYASIGYIPQSLPLFDDSIAFNLSLGQEFSKEKLTQVLGAVGLEKLVAEKGLDFVIGLDGQNLSGGERARLVIVRALIRDYSMLLMNFLLPWIRKWQKPFVTFSLIWT